MTHHASEGLFHLFPAVSGGLQHTLRSRLVAVVAPHGYREGGSTPRLHHRGCGDLHTGELGLGLGHVLCSEIRAGWWFARSSLSRTLSPSALNLSSLDHSPKSNSASLMHRPAQEVSCYT
jgi:hypothetical protein